MILQKVILRWGWFVGCGKFPWVQQERKSSRPNLRSLFYHMKFTLMRSDWCKVWRRLRQAALQLDCEKGSESLAVEAAHGNSQGFLRVKMKIQLCLSRAGRRMEKVWWVVSDQGLRFLFVVYSFSFLMINLDRSVMSASFANTLSVLCYSSCFIFVVARADNTECDSTRTNKEMKRPAVDESRWCLRLPNASRQPKSSEKSGI